MRNDNLFRKTILISVALFSATALSAQSIVADKVVAVVGNSAILYSEVVDQSRQIVEEARAQGYTPLRDPMSEALETLMLQKLLYQQSLIDSVSIDHFSSAIQSQVDAQLDEMIHQAGSVKELEKQQHRPLFSIKDELRSQIEEMYAAYSMRSQIESAVKITPGEVTRFYRHIDKDSLPLIPEQYVYAQITRLPRSTEEAKRHTKERLLELRERIIKGARFDMLARMYSMDPGSAIRGGEIDPGPKENWLPSFADALTKLKPGQVSGIVETEYGYHLIQLIDMPSPTLYHFRHILLKPDYTDDELTATLVSLDSIANLIREGTLTFEEAALQNSDDPFSRLNGGIVSNHDIMELMQSADASATRIQFPKENIPPTDYRELSRLSEGQMSQAFLAKDFKENVMGKLVKLVRIIPTHTANLTEDYLDIEQIALRDKQNNVFLDWVNRKIDGMYVRIDPMFSADEFENKNWFK